MATDEVSRLSGIYAILNEGDRVVDLCRASLAAGITVVQYRAKDGIDAEHLRSLRTMTREARALLIVNDDWRAAAAFDCDGVHLGPDDDGFTDISVARAALGPNRLIGLSCGTVAEAESAQAMGADYIGVGAVYATASKADAGEPIGVDGLRRVARATALPVAAIGGIDGRNLAAVRATGVPMAAVISAIAGATDPLAAASELVRAWTTDALVQHDLR